MVMIIGSFARTSKSTVCQVSSYRLIISRHQADPKVAAQNAMLFVLASIPGR